ncbi:MAG: hypothetical protein C3L25_12640 [Candidatus Sedimenticola endophacoides]|nr:MAG: hypothetical protein C3L26_12730 [Candidatus Sedimenticola endophacoides]PUE01283.1 MAG: hypothetical protein C3L25_12640 [Candidatus Sedimenticola endophacoides]
MLAVDGLSKSFGGVSAVSDLSFRVPEGLVYSVIGPNGAGKTTLFNMLSGIYVPDEGSIRYQDREIVGSKPHRIAAMGVSRTFQNLQMFFNMSVMDNVQECRYLVKDFGTSQSPKSTRQRDSRYCPDRPALITTPSRTLQQSCSCATPS